MNYVVCLVYINYLFRAGISRAGAPLEYLIVLRSTFTSCSRTQQWNLPYCKANTTCTSQPANARLSTSAEPSTSSSRRAPHLTATSYAIFIYIGKCNWAYIISEALEFARWLIINLRIMILAGRPVAWVRGGPYAKLWGGPQTLLSCPMLCYHRRSVTQNIGFVFGGGDTTINGA